uniref:Uncharacterized protein n=1 Tax=Leptocylindrus danicus TaxID=163516 RepID=A0A7S2P2P6_9STRA|mmetsp:Transcript_2159/g.3176  ORF Transcript_2159/g.3176 Transcript_2159/m.3176 type:complete len:109 (+) Transcript_2159:313-639(+)
MRNFLLTETEALLLSKVQLQIQADTLIQEKGLWKQIRKYSECTIFHEEANTKTCNRGNRWCIMYRPKYWDRPGLDDSPESHLLITYWYATPTKQTPPATAISEISVAS